MDKYFEDNQILLKSEEIDKDGNLSRFADSYAAFNRVINRLQRQYLELKDEFSTQNETLAETNQQLIEVTANHLAATDFLNTLLKSIPAGVIAVDSKGYVTHFNPTASIMFGIPVNEPLGKQYREIIPPGDPVDANALRTFEAGKQFNSIEKKIELIDGTRLLLSVSTTLLKNDRGEPVGAVEVFHDLTRIKRMEKKIARLDTLAALGEMAAAVAHQVRNPLSGILGYGSLLKRDLADDDPRQKLVTRITEGVETLNSTVTTLLNYSKDEEINREIVEPTNFLESVLVQFKHENIDLAKIMKFVLQPKDPSIEDIQLFIDPILVSQVLHNLFSNACEVCEGEGIVTINYRKLPRQKATEKYGDKLMLSLEETLFEISVRDNGPGLPEKESDNIFAPFFTTRKGGHGLGLAVASKIIKGHGGFITAENAPGGGAEFIFVLPIRIKTIDDTL